MLMEMSLCFFPFSIKTSKFIGTCDNVNYPYVNICVPDVVKNSNVKVFNLKSRTNETRSTEWHETCKRVNLEKVFVITNNVGIKINADVNCKELIDKGMYDKGFIWNSSNCEFECDKACDFGEYLDYDNCKCRKRLVAPLIEECTETVEEVKLAKIILAENENSYKCISCTMYTVLFWRFLTINVAEIGAYFVYFHGCLKRMFTRETTIY